MSLFSRFFAQAQPAPMPVPTPSVDTALASQIAAITAMPDSDLLRQLAGVSGATVTVQESSEALTRAARSRMAQLIDEGVIEVGTAMGQSPDPIAVLSLVTLCKQPERLPSALAQVTDHTRIVELVITGTSSRLRQLAAETIEDPLQLRELIRQVRDKDKGVYKILKTKSDALLAAERQRTELAAEVDAVSVALERHGQRPFDPTYESTLAHLRTRWRLLSERPTAEAELRVDGAVQRCRQIISDHEEQLSRLQAEQAALDAERSAARQAEDLRRQEADAAAAARRESQDQAEKALAAEQAAARAAEQAALDARLSAGHDLHRQIDGGLRRANAALNDGDTKRASALRRSLDDKLAAAPGLPPPLTRQLQQLDAKLQELKQWKDFAVAPKRAELVTEMESLVGSAEEPKLLAERIRGLQDEWRTINKGIVGDAPAEADRFQRAAQLAFQPCRQYFEAQANLRRGNLEKRKAVFERVTTFASTQAGEGFDWRLVSQALREAPLEWRAAFPVDRDAARPLQDEFDACLKRLKSQLADWYDHNVAEKQALIDQARQLLERSDSREAIEAVKQLQARWKDTKPAPRDRDRVLWGEFRGLCDEVFKKRQQEHADYVGSLEANRSAVVALCEEVEQCAALEGAELTTAIAQIPQWRARWDAAGELPRADARRLEDRIERAIERCKARLAGQRALDAAKADADVMEGARLVRACEWAAVAGATDAERTVLHDAATAFLDAAHQWPKGSLPVLMAALAKAQSTTAAEISVREKALRMMCIRCEILTGMTTAPEDQALRREYQVQRLMQGMGQGSRGEEVTAQSALLDWLRIPAISPELHALLQERFTQCLTRMNLRRPANG